jgi:hypothetical protein
MQRVALLYSCTMWRGSEAGSHLLLLFHARAAFLSQELREKTPLQHGCILVGADNGALQNDRGVLCVAKDETSVDIMCRGFCCNFLWNIRL